MLAAGIDRSDMRSLDRGTDLIGEVAGGRLIDLAGICSRRKCLIERVILTSRVKQRLAWVMFQM